MATYGGDAIDDSFIANADLSAKQYYWVKCGSVAGEVALATGGSAPMALGILQNNPKQGDAAVVRLLGVSKMAAFGELEEATASPIAHGDPIGTGSLGKGCHMSGCVFHAIALEALAIGTTATIKVFVVPPGMRLAEEQ